MKIILVDDEEWTMDQFELESQGIQNVEIVGKYINPYDAIEYVKINEVNIAILDVEMPQMNGIELGREMKRIKPDIVIIYISGYEEYINEAILKVKADYYLLKPYNHEEVLSVLERAEQLSVRQKKRIEIRTFGRFDVFVNGSVLPFTNSKAKELLALCVDQRGGLVTMEYAIGILWEDRVYDSKVKSLYRKAVIYIHSLLREINSDDLFISNRGSCFVDCSIFSCDYYNYLKNKNNGEKLFHGEYLTEYSWAETTTALLINNYDSNEN